jgi:hypothetical protein
MGRGGVGIGRIKTIQRVIRNEVRDLAYEVCVTLDGKGGQPRGDRSLDSCRDVGMTNRSRRLTLKA